MTDYMTLHASAYPPSNWKFIPKRRPKPSQTSRNELWVEMTHRYEQSMAVRQHLSKSNSLSETATRANIRRMSPEVKKKYNRRGTLTLENTAEVEEILEITGDFVWIMDKLKKHPMKTIREQAIKNRRSDDRLNDSDKIRISFGARLKEISGTYYDFIHTPIRNHFRPRSAQIGHVNEDINAQVALAQEQLTSDVAQLRDFLRGRLFDQYCLMRATPMEKKDKTWLKYGECMMGYGESNREVGDRLRRMINESGLDPYWVMEHIEEYYNGNEHIGQWQRYAQSRRWDDLAEKFTKDIQQLQRINSTKSKNSRRCNIMFNIYNSKRMFFKTLDGPRGWELSDKALEMEKEECYESSSTSSSASSATTWLVTVS